MQALHDGDHQGAGEAAAAVAHGLLESADGVARLFRNGQLIAKCYGARSDYLEGTYVLGDSAFQLEWRRWSMSRLIWSHSSAMLFLQGLPLLQLVQPFLILAGSVRPVMSPEPGMNGVVLAEIYASSSDVTVPQLFQLLAPEARS